MTVLFWWMAIVWIVVIAATVVVVRLVRSRRAGPAPVPVAHTERLTALPGYRTAVRRYRRLVIALASVLAVLLVASVGLTLRFANVTVDEASLRNRDIVLCLDVSGSMVDYDKTVIDTFAQLAKKFEGERLSLVVFNASAVTYFPLTSDLAYIEKQFATLKKEFASPDQSYFSGTLVGNGSSLIGDGLASCATRFDAQGTDRSRSIILVTDNMLAGKPIYTLKQAGALATSRKIRVYGINPGDQTAKNYLQSLATEYKQVVTATGGGYYALSDPTTVPSIVQKITAQQAALTKGPVQVVYDDRLGLGVWLLLFGLIALFALAWRLRR
jgi:Ca-activated chloride channel homolog